jgi:hypothetical protein
MESESKYPFVEIWKEDAGKGTFERSENVPFAGHTVAQRLDASLPSPDNSDSAEGMPEALCVMSVRH